MGKCVFKAFFPEAEMCISRWSNEYNPEAEMCMEYTFLQLLIQFLLAILGSLSLLDPDYKVTKVQQTSCIK